MALSTQPYKGARDFYPEEKRVQNYLFRKMSDMAERFGYEEYNAPILEPTDLYLSKGNQEIIDEQTYTFQDRGGRSVTVRTEMTPTVSRLVAGRRQQLVYPIRWYSIANFWRYERTQKGRLREFWQLNADIFGVEGTEAEQELISLAAATFRSFGAKPNMFVIRLNNRKFINYVMRDYLGFDEVQSASMIRLIDRIRKMDRADFIAQADAICSPSQRETGTVEKMLAVFEAKRFATLPAELQKQPDLLELQLLMERLQESGITNIEFDSTMVRGFDYYTATIFEGFDTDPENNRSLFGGGRYNGLVGSFGVEPVPTAGFAIGDVTLENFLIAHNLLPKPSTETDIYVVFAGTAAQQAQPVITELRDNGLNIAVDFSGRKLDKQITTAVKKGVRYALVVGDQELAEKRYTLRDLSKGTEEKHGVARIVSIVQDFRKPPKLLEDEA